MAPTIKLQITDETSPLKSVILGTGQSIGDAPTLQEAYDPKSILHIKNGTYPSEGDIVNEMEGFKSILTKYDVEVYRPDLIKGLNQVFARDIGFTIEDRFVVPQILSDRQDEINGIRYIINQLKGTQILQAPKGARIEGGDIMPWKGKIFIGYSEEEDFSTYTVARTNKAGVDFIIDHFKNWDVHAFELNKSDIDPVGNALHLDCCFQPVGKDQCIICPDGFKNKADYHFLKDFFGKDNTIEISSEEMYQMNCNVFSINEQVVVSEKQFSRVNTLLRDRGLTVEEIPYSETSKMGGLLRCSTLPLERN